MEDEWGAPSFADAVLRWFFIRWLNQNFDTSQEDEEGLDGAQDIEEVEHGSTPDSPSMTEGTDNGDCEHR